MITSLRLVNFKNFADETLRVGPFTVIVGANASGKSNIRDAFRFLHGIGRGYNLAEIIGGKYGAGGQSEWDPIRGAPNEIARVGQSPRPRMRDFSLHVELDLDGQRTFYSITVRFSPSRPDAFRVLEEELRTSTGTIYTTLRRPRSSQLTVLIGEGRKQHSIRLSRAQPVLTQFSRARYRRLLTDPMGSRQVLHSTLGSMRFLELSPQRMREPSVPGATTLGDFGQNLPTVLESICTNTASKENLTSWLRELTPMDVEDFTFPRDPSGRTHLRIREASKRTVSAYSASDGTLRFLAMLAALLGDNPAGIYFFEEIDTGIYPNRLWLLVDLIERQTAKGGIQVITTTHSPDMLNFINDNTFESTSVVSRLEDTDDAIIRSVDSLPKAKKLRESYGLGRLHSTAWMETTLAFTEGYDDEDQGD